MCCNKSPKSVQLFTLFLTDILIVYCLNQTSKVILNIEIKIKEEMYEIILEQIFKI